MPTTAIREGRSRDFLARCPPRLGRVGIGLVELYAPEYRAPWQRESPGFERGSANHRRLAARDIQAAVGLKHSATSRWLACGRGQTRGQRGRVNSAVGQGGVLLGAHGSVRHGQSIRRGEANVIACRRRSGAGLARPASRCTGLEILRTEYSTDRLQGQLARQGGGTAKAPHWAGVAHGVAFVTIR